MAPSGAPGTPPNDSLSCASGGVGNTYSWGVASGDVWGYKVYYGPSYPPPFVVDVGMSYSWTYTPAWSTTTYWYQVTAYNGYGESDKPGGWGMSPCDTVWPTQSGSPTYYSGWRNTIPTLTQSTWQDTYSGLQSNAVYSLGTSPGATNLLGETSMPVQPASGQTTPWNPSWQPALRQGINWVNTKVLDRAGNYYYYNGFWQVSYDNVAPTVSGNVITTPWTNNPNVSGVCFADATSGIYSGATYKVGSSPGASDYLASTTMPVQPSGGPLSWCHPSFAVSGLRQGNNYVTITVVDGASNGLTASSYVVRYDGIAPTASGAPVTTAWLTSNPTLSGVCFTDTLTGLANSATYIVGSSAGASNYQGSTTMPTQPTAGQTSAWCPSFSISASALRQGSNYVTVIVSDVAGNVLSTQAYVIRYDTAAPAPANAPITTAWSNTNPTLSGVCFTDPHSGLATSATYWMGSSAGASDYQGSTSMPTQPTSGQTSQWCPAGFSVPVGNLRQGNNYVTIRTVDQLGNAGNTAAYVIRYDTGVPTASGSPSPPINLGWVNTNPNLSGVCFMDTVSGLASATYWVGSAPGGNDYLTSTSLPSQPSVGTTSNWCHPGFQVQGSAVHLGANYVTIGVLDQASNSLATQSYVFSYDNLVPTTGTINWPGGVQSPGWTNNNSPDFTWNPQDTGGSGLVGGTLGSQHALDGTTSGFYSHNSQPYSNLADGAHTFTVTVQDNAGSSASSSYPFQIDTVAPTQATPATSMSPNAYGWYNGDVALRIDSADSRSGIQCEKHSLLPNTGFSGACPDDTWTASTEGTVTYYGQATDKATNTYTEAQGLTIKLDKSAPTLTDNQPDVSWTTVNPALQVTFGDSVSGIQKLEYAIYSGPGQTGTQLKAWTTFFSTTGDGTTSYTNPWSADSSSFQQGDNYVSARVTDRASNSVMQQVAKIQWDTVTPSRATPTVNAGTNPNNGWYKVQVGMYVDSADVTSGVQCEQHSNIATPVWSSLPCPGQETWTDGTEGTESWYGRAQDQAGNAFISTGVPIAVDVTAPTSSPSLSGTAGNAGWYTSNVVATITGADAVSGLASIHTKLDAASWITTAASSVPVAINTDGTHTVSYYAVDTATNADGTDSNPKTVTVPVDRTAPVTGNSLTGTVGSPGWYQSDVTATITASDATSGLLQLWYQVDGTPWQNTIQPSHVISFTTPGTHTFSYYALDVAGNNDGSSGAPHTVTFGIDQVKPVATDAQSGTVGNAGWYKSAVTVTLTSTDDMSGVLETRYGINAPSMPMTYSSPFAVNTEGVNQVYYRAQDRAGNLQTTVTRTISVDTIVPTYASWVQTPSNVDASSTGTVQVSVSVDPTASGLSSADYRYSYDNGATWSSWSATTAGSGLTRSFSIPQPGTGWWTHKTDTLLYEVRANDVAGNQATAQRSDLIQRVNPTVSIQTPTAGVTWGHSVHAIQWTGQDLDHDSVTYTVRVSSDGGGTYGSAIYTNTVSENGASNSYSYNWDTGAAGIATGSNYVIKVTADDGQAAANSVTAAFSIDNTAPSINLLTPAVGKFYVQDVSLADPLGETRVAGQYVTLKASASETGSATSGVVAVRYYVDGQLLTTLTSPAGSGNYEYIWNLVGLLGEHILGVQSQDGVGNLSTMLTRTVAVVESTVNT